MEGNDQFATEHKTIHLFFYALKMAYSNCLNRGQVDKGKFIQTPRERQSDNLCKDQRENTQIQPR